MIREKIESHFRVLDLPDDAEVSVVLTDDDEIRELNAKWREEDKATDVLSFPMMSADELEDLRSEDEDDSDESPPGPPIPPTLGDIVISVEYAEKLVETAEHQKRVADELDIPTAELEWTLAEEVHFLFIHGLLHLVGHDHLEEDEEAEMKAMERELWQASR